MRLEGTATLDRGSTNTRWVAPSVLAAYAASTDAERRARALAEVPKLPNGWSLLYFVGAVAPRRGWGPALRKAIGAWYAQADPVALAQEVHGGLALDGWRHRDVIAKAHPKPASFNHAVVFAAAFGRRPTIDGMASPEVLAALEGR